MSSINKGNFHSLYVSNNITTINQIKIGDNLILGKDQNENSSISFHNDGTQIFYDNGILKFIEPGGPDGNIPKSLREIVNEMTLNLETLDIGGDKTDTIFFKTKNANII